jgi:cytochrome b
MSKIRVWDLPLRLFHWALVMLVAVLVITGKTGGAAMQWHFLAGYGVLALVLFRVVWGFIGSATSRFSYFVHGCAAIRSYLKGQWQRNGHNPLGAWSVLAMLGMLLFQASIGLFSNDDIASEGPLAKLISKDVSDSLSWLHKAINVNLLYALVGLHVAAILYYSIFKRKNLVMPMITGMQTAKESGDAVVDSWSLRLLALAVFTGICGLIALLVNY